MEDSQFYIYWNKSNLPYTVKLDGNWEVCAVSISASESRSSAGTPLLLCTNLCEDSIVGSRTLPILRELSSVDAAYREFNPLQYHRVRQSSFNSIKIELLNHQGQLLPTIIESCTLHFRRSGSLCDQGWSG